MLKRLREQLLKWGKFPLLDETTGVSIRPLKKDEVPSLTDWFSDTELLRIAFGIAPHADDDYVVKLGQEYYNALLSSQKHVMAILREGRIIGVSHYLNVIYKGQEVSLLGIMIASKAHRGHGYGTASLSLLLKYLFEALHVHAVEVETGVDNLAAQRCYEKLGFVRCDHLCALSVYGTFDTSMYAPSLYLHYTEQQWRRDHTDPA